MRFLLSLILVFAVSIPGLARAYPSLDVSATAGIVLDSDTGQVLWAREAQTRMPTSSMSKVMTAMVVFDAIREGKLKLTDMLLVSEKAWRMEGSKMFVQVGSQVPVEDLIKGMIVQSGNDACVVLAEAVAGSEEAFVDRMNEKAQSIGMTNSHFTNSTGWPDPDHYSTPEDLALLARYLILNYPEEYKYYSIPEYTWNDIKQGNRNPLLGKVQGADGVKTGHTEVAGYGLIGSAIQNGRRIVFVMNGWEGIMDRFNEGPRVMEWAFRNFENIMIAKGGAPLAQIDVAYGKNRTVPAGLERDLKFTQPVGAKQQGIRYIVRGKTPVKAPIAKGALLGELVVVQGDQVLTSYPLVALEDAPEGSIIDTIRTNLMRMLKN